MGTEVLLETMAEPEEKLNAILNYECVVVPSSMRSLYWKYFGFPADMHSKIITRNKIICILCSGMIAYNKNTSNLRTHLVAKHPEILIELNNERQSRIEMKIQQNKRKMTIPIGTPDSIEGGDGGGASGDDDDKQSILVNNRKRIKASVSTVQPSSSSSLITKKLIPEERFDENDGALMKPTITILENNQGNFDDDNDGMEDEMNNEIDNEDNKRKTFENLHIKLSSSSSNNNGGNASIIKALQNADNPNHVNHIRRGEHGGAQEGRLIRRKPIQEEHTTEFVECNDYQTYSVTLSSSNGQQESYTIEQISDEPPVPSNSTPTAPATTYALKNPSINNEINSGTKNIENNKIVKKFKSENYSKTTTTVATRNDEVNIIDLFIKDLLPLSLAEGQQFRNFVSTLNPNYILPKRYDLECNLKRMYNENFYKIDEFIKEHCNKHKFSLSTEIWNNIEGRTLLSVYFNLNKNLPKNDKISKHEHEQEIGDQELPNLTNIFYKTIELKQQQQNNENNELKDLFIGINLKNCTAAILNQQNDIVNEFLCQHEIPSVMCFETIINNCLKKIFKLPSIDNLFERICALIEEDPDNIGEFVSLDYYSNEDPCSKFYILSMFCENISWNESIQDFIMEAKNIRSFLQPLKTTLETLADEPIGLCSLVKPFTQQLLNEHFQVNEDDSELALEIKNIINEELTNLITLNEFYGEAAFFDPRFHSFMNPNDIEQIKNNLNEKFIKENKLLKTNIENLSVKKLKNNDENSLNRRSSIKQFFNRPSHAEQSTSNVTKTNFNLELTKYMNDAINVDLEQCPIMWWLEYGYIYRILKEFAKKYFCIPCCFNNTFRMNSFEQIQLSNRKFQLKYSSLNYLWFLYYNRDMM